MNKECTLRTRLMHPHNIGLGMVLHVLREPYSLLPVQCQIYCHDCRSLHLQLANCHFPDASCFHKSVLHLFLWRRYVFQHSSSYLHTLVFSLGRMSVWCWGKWWYTALIDVCPTALDSWFWWYYSLIINSYFFILTGAEKILNPSSPSLGNTIPANLVMLAAAVKHCLTKYLFQEMVNGYPAAENSWSCETPQQCSSRDMGLLNQWLHSHGYWVGTLLD